MKRILVTGANGFIGTALCAALEVKGYAVRKAVRSERDARSAPTEVVTIGDIGRDTDWTKALLGIDVVVHLAGRVHMARATSVEALRDFRAVNVGGTERLAQQSVHQGVEHFLYVSTAKVNGDGSAKPYLETDTPRPGDAYAVSKWETEQMLHQVGKKNGMAVTILRPPLVYGPGVRGNLLRLLRYIRRGIPLPLGSARNMRSYVGIGNLVNFASRCIEHSSAKDQTFLIADGTDLSTAELVRCLARYSGRSSRLFPCPAGVAYLLGKMVNKGDDVARLWGAFQVDIRKAQTLLGWEPPFTTDEGLRETVRWFLARSD